MDGIHSSLDELLDTINEAHTHASRYLFRLQECLKHFQQIFGIADITNEAEEVEEKSNKQKKRPSKNPKTVSNKNLEVNKVANLKALIDQANKLLDHANKIKNDHKIPKKIANNVEKQQQLQVHENKRKESQSPSSNTTEQVEKKYKFLEMSFPGNV
jgi:hypothetical protein